MTDEPDNAAPFRAMADRITTNAVADFGGAVVIMPPGDEKPVEILLLRNEQNPGMFWALVKTQAEISLSELAAKEQQATWGRR